MHAQFFRLHLTGLVLMAVLAGCGGGGGIAGIDGSGSNPDTSVSGTINSFGSVIVDGEYFNTDNARIYLNGELRTELDLRVGQYVTVVGKRDEIAGNTALEVHQYARITGPVENLDADGDQMEVLGQRVRVQSQTIFDSSIQPRQIRGLAEGDWITVSGGADANQAVRATRIDRAEPGPVSLLGIVESRQGQEPIIVSGVKVDLSQAEAQVPAEEGDYLNLTGTLLPDGTVQVARYRQAMDFRALQGIATVTIKGFARAVDADEKLLFLDNVPVQWQDTTQMIGGNLTDLLDNRALQIRGQFADGILQASAIRFVVPVNRKLSGEIENLEIDSDPSTRSGQITVRGLNLRLNAQTYLAGEEQQRIALGDLRIGERVLVSGYQLGDEFIVASLTVDHRALEGKQELRGNVHSVRPELQRFTVYGTQVITDENTRFSAGRGPIEANTLFDLLDEQLILVVGELQGEYLLAHSVRILPAVAGEDQSGPPEMAPVPVGVRRGIR